MCWNAETSIITLVIGTILNVWNITYYKHPTITAISILWQYVLLMQLFEAVAWMNQPGNGKTCNNANKYAAKGAYLANVTQPIVFAVIMFAMQGHKGNDESHLDQTTKIIAACVLMGYTLWLLYATNKAPEVDCLKPETECGNLTFTWWQHFEGNAMVYMVALISLILLMVKPFKFAAMQLSYIVATFLISAYFYSCGVGSVWCWFAAFAPLLVGPMWEASQ